MRRVLSALAIFASSMGAACAGMAPVFMWNGGGGSLAAPQVQIGVGGTEFFGYSNTTPTFINWFKGSQYNLNGNAPTVLDANQYPNAAAMTASMSFNPTFQPTRAIYSGNWEEGWTGTWALQNQSTITVVSDPQSCNQGSGLFSGTNCDVTFSYTADPNGAVTIPQSTYSGVSGAFLIRSSDKTDYTNGKVFLPEFRSIVNSSGLNPLALRTMSAGLTIVGSWRDRLPVAAASYGLNYWVPNDWAGADTTHTDNYVLTSYPNMPGSWTDSELFQASFTHASNTTIAITAAANDSGNNQVQLTVGSTAALSTNQNVLVANCASNLPPTVYAITVKTGTTLDLQGTTYSSGVWSNCPVSASFAPGFISTTTVNVGSRGPKFVLPLTNLGFFSVPSSTIASSDTGTFVYNALLGVLLYTSGGITYISGGEGPLPPEIMAELANEAGTALWWNIPPFWHAADVNSAVSYFNSNLNSDLFIEYNNENWNFLSVFMTQNGYALGLPNGSNEGLYSYVGLEIRQLFGAATSAWTRGSSHLHRINAAQAGAGTLAPDFASYQFAGAALCGTSCGNSTYQAAVGTDYNVSPNRPKDFSDAYAIATYFQGAQAQGDVASSLTQITGMCNGTTCTGLIAAASCYAAPSNTTCGTGGTAALAYQFIDNDLRSGNLIGQSGCANNNTTISCIEPGFFTTWQGIANTDGKQLVAYEGGFSGAGPSVAGLTALGDGNASTDATNINNLLIAYRNQSLFQTTYTLLNTTWFSNSTVTGNANLGVEAGTISIGAYNLGLMPGLFPFAPYQNYNAIKAINYLLKRDLNPASNDNDPVGLSKVA